MQFKSPKDMLNFVEKWVFMYGEPQRPEKKTSMNKRFEKQFREFKDIVHDLFQPYSDSEDNDSPAEATTTSSPKLSPPDTPPQAAPAPAPAPAVVSLGARTHNELDVDCDCNDCVTVNSQRQHKIFEILRIRNRLDPSLLDVPGGYRDFALKIKIGFFRWI